MRVHILPFLGEQELYKQFHLNEPWDSPHNLTLIPKMPAVYAGSDQPLEYKTTFLVPVGKGTSFEGSDGQAAGAITDGRDRTIIFVQANNDRAVTWTSPEDLKYVATDPMSGLGTLHPGGLFIVAMADGQVQTILSSEISTEVLRSLFTFAKRD